MSRHKRTIIPAHRFDKMMMTCASGHEANPVDYSKNSLTMLTTTPLIAQGFRPQVNVKLNDHNPYSNCSGRSSNGSNVRTAHHMKNHTSGSNYILPFCCSQNQDENNNGSLRNIPQLVQSPPHPLIDHVKSSPDAFVRDGYGMVEHSHSPFVESGSHDRPPSHAYDNQQPSTSSQAEVSPHEGSLSSFHLQELKKNVGVGFVCSLFVLWGLNG